MIRDLFNPKFVFTAPVVNDDPTRPLDRKRFVGYVDGLQWLEQANEAAAQEPRPAAGAKKSMAARR